MSFANRKYHLVTYRVFDRQRVSAAQVDLLAAELRRQYAGESVMVKKVERRVSALNYTMPICLVMVVRPNTAYVSRAERRTKKIMEAEAARRAGGPLT